MSIEHYPPAPAAVPDGLTVAPPSYRRNVWLAVTGLLGFVLAYAALTGWFAYKAVTLLGYAWQGGPRALMAGAAGLVAAFLAVFLGKAMFFVRHHGDRGLIELKEADEPQLFAFLRRLAAETGAKAPYRVYLSPRVNAAVFYDLSLLNLLVPSRKNLEIGVGLVNALTLAEFKAVLAHELGHFAQRSMAVGSWVYIAQQIVGHIVAKRDVLDRFLLGLSRIDLRVAWIGWGLRLIVWSIRSVMDSVFGVIVMAERALSREMELQADLVSVSVSGSDALVHALRKLPAADSAWDTALDVFAGELRAGRLAPDLCAMQTRVLECTRRVLADPQYGAAPPLPEAERAQHRVFTAGLCQPPQMWSTHPPSHVREDNAKRRYVAAELDERPAWLVFGDAGAIRRKIVDHVADLVGKPDKLAAVDLDAALAAVDRRHDKLFLDPRYRGAYLGRSITRSVDKPNELCAPGQRDLEAVRAALRALYPESLSARVGLARAQAGEVAQLEAIRRGVATAPGGVIRYGGREFRRRELGDVIAAAKQAHADSLAALREHDRASRSAHHDAAALLGRGWPEYLASLRALLHYAEHTEANIDDAGGHLRNVVAIVTADGKVTSGEARKLIVSGGDLQHVLRSVFEQRTHVTVPAPVLERLAVESWQSAFPGDFGLPAPQEENLGAFMDVVDGWFNVFSNNLGGLRGATLDELLTAEAKVARAALDGEDPGDAPAPARVPLHYSAFRHGQEREHLRLDWWDRFVLADGLGPGLTRLTVAGAVVSVVVGFGGAVGSPTVVIHNGLGRDVVVSVGEQEVTVPGHGREELQITPDDGLPVRARTADQREIEAFVADAANPAVDYLYNIGGASPLVQWIAVYGYTRGPEPKILGAPRWLATDADDILREPPRSVSSRGSSQRKVITALAEGSLRELLAQLDPAESDRVRLFHARWEPSDGPDAAWLMAAFTAPGFADVLQARRADGDTSVMLGRLEQQANLGAAHDAVCERHRAQAAAEPASVDAAYLAARCIDDEAARDARFLELHERHPEHPWLKMASSYVRFERDEFEAAALAIEAATRQLPALAEDNALLLARLRRRASPQVEPELAPLAEQSLMLRYHLAMEAGEQIGTLPLITAYHSLALGQPALAVEQAPADQLARVVRLAAASDGADDTLVAAALKLGPDEGINGATLFTAIAFAAAHGLDTAPYVERLRREDSKYVDRMLRFIAREELLADLEAAKRTLRTLNPVLRGQAAVMGLITLRAEAPPEWRLDARRLLFATERPYFAERVEPPTPPAPVEEPPAPPKKDRRGARRSK